MDKITESFLNDFVESCDLQALARSDQFEVFSAYCVVSREYDDDFDPSDLKVGGSADLGIDAAALIVNGNLVADEEEIRDLRSRNNYLQGRIIIVQAKTSAEFSANVITDLVSRDPVVFTCRCCPPAS